MPRKAATVAPEPAEPTTRALVNGEVVVVPVSAIVFEPGAFQDAYDAHGPFTLLKMGRPVGGFIPRLFPRVNGTYSLLGWILR
jgi:hypothetical protein